MENYLMVSKNYSEYQWGMVRQVKAQGKKAWELAEKWEAELNRFEKDKPFFVCSISYSAARIWKNFEDFENAPFYHGEK